MNEPWNTTHPNVKVLDCTIRDGGLVNNHHFTDSFVRAIYDTSIAAGVDTMEIGYKNSQKVFSVEEMGAWRFCQEDDIRRVIGDNPSKLKISCMMDAGKSDWHKDVLPSEKSVIDIIRVAFYAHQVEEAVEMIQGIYDRGYMVSANLMAVTAVDELELDKCLEKVVQTNAEVIVVVDSYGTMFPDQTQYLTEKYFRFASPVGKAVGMHAHNNQQLAFANTIEAIRHGATHVDATVGGLGRGAGNCPMELLLGFLKDLPRYKVRPIYECLEKEFVKLGKQIEWGPFPEYMITGQFNQHPRSAIKARETEQKDHYIAFYDMVSEMK